MADLPTCLQPTGNRWGTKIADVKLRDIPKNLVGMALVDGDSLRLVFYRWDRYEYLGWEEDFLVTLNDKPLLVPSSSRLVDGHSFSIQLDSKIPSRPQQQERKIPRVLWNISTQSIEKRSSHAIRRLLWNLRGINDLIQCTSTYFVLDEKTCESEVASAGIPNFIEAYRALVPGSYKADLVRYWLLYKYGGVYTDDKCTIRSSLDSDAFDAIFIPDGAPATDMFIGVIGWGGGVPEIAFMGSRPGCPIFLKALEASIDNIMNRRYGTDRLAITGSTMLRSIMQDGVEPERRLDLMSQPPVNPAGIGMNRIKCWGENVALLRVENCYEKIFYQNELVWHRQAIPFNDWPKGSTYYWNLWNLRQVYVDGNVQAPLTARVTHFFSREGTSTVFGVLLGVMLLAGFAFIIHTFPALSW